LHVSWFIIFALITLSLAKQFTSQHPGWSQTQHYALGIITSLLFFASVVFHELSHSFVARRYGIPVQSITLFIFGGLAGIGREPNNAKQEFNIAIAGPLSSLFLGGCFWLVTHYFHANELVVASCTWLWEINVMLAVFNLIPGFPLDGGRVLRSIAWGITGDFTRATKIASYAGRFFAYVMIFIGVWWAFHGSLVNGIWTAFIGWFLMQAAGASYATVSLSSGLKGAHVSDVMERNCEPVDGNLNVERFVEDYLLRSGRRCFVIEQQGEIAGLITPHEIKAVERPRWPYTTLYDIMRPLDQLHTVEPNTPLMEALETMGRDDVNQLPVVSNHHLEGIVTRANVLQFLQTRAELSR